MVIPFKSAQPMNMKIASLSQDAYRILSNCEKHTERSTVIQCLEEFCSRLRISGYPVKVAGKILRNGIVTYRRRLAREEGSMVICWDTIFKNFYMDEVGNKLNKI